jgi:excinuclease UvrABC ATPase subunit
MIIERKVKDKAKKFIIANPEKVRQWLKYLFANHRDYIRMSRNNQLHYSPAAVEALKSQSELAEIVYDNVEANGSRSSRQDAITQAAMESGLSKAEVYTFDKYPNLYLKTQEILKIKRRASSKSSRTTPCVNRPTGLPPT